MQYHIDISDDQHHDFRTAYAEAIGKVIENDASEMAIAVNDIESFDSLIYPVLLGIASKLKKSGYTDIAGIRVYLETKENQSKLTSGVILASYVSNAYRQEILTDPRATDTVFITNNTKALKNYLSNNESELLSNDL